MRMPEEEVWERVSDEIGRTGAMLGELRGDLSEYPIKGMDVVRQRAIIIAQLQLIKGRIEGMVMALEMYAWPPR